VEVRQSYDDGGHSGGSLKRPALQRLIDDVEANRIDLVVIYKIDRLSRSLTDFVRLMDLFDKYDVSFVSVTQTFDTSDSMGRLVLNILLTFAQFERELAGERIRDRYEEKRRRGLYGGGCPPTGYMVKRGGVLVPDPDRAETVRRLFLDFPNMSSEALAKRLTDEGFTTRMYVSRHGKKHGGQKFHASQLLQILRNPVYAGYCYRRGELTKAQVEPLVTLEQWQRVQEVYRSRILPARDPNTNFLLGILHDEVGRPMGLRHRGHGRSPPTRHYKSRRGTAFDNEAKSVMVEAERTEKLAVSVLQSLFTDPVKLKEAVLSLGEYSPEIARSLRRGNLAARRLSLMQGKELRELFLALVPRMEVAPSELRLLVCCYELRRFLAWDGTGLFSKSHVRPRGSYRFRLLYAPAYLHCGHSRYAIPLQPHCGPVLEPRSDLVDLLARAAELKDLVLHNRSKSIQELSHARHLGSIQFCRILRVNYLAPDIQAAIMDGTQPPDLTPHKILFGSLPLDWQQQRHLLGFESVDAGRFAAVVSGKRARVNA
jgi:DNA invertase Pin-like site-specific DNA recombinase